MTRHVLTVANAERVAYQTTADIMEPPPPVDYVHWAEENIVFSKRESQFEGPYNRQLFGYFDEVLRALSPDDPCRLVTLKKSAQLGGTVLANVFTGGSMDMDPGDFLYVHPTDDNATRWSKLKLSPFIKGTPVLKSIFPQKSRDGSDSIHLKERRDGRGALLISGANSPASLSQVSMPRQVQDDLAKWDMNNAGDPETQADSRSLGYEFAKIFKVSTPMVEPGCRISRNYDDGSQERLFVPCPHCDHMQTLEWENMLEALDEDKPEDACFTCVECGATIEQHHRWKMRQNAEWRADYPDRKRFHRSFYIWSAYSELQSWERIARAWLKAKGDPKSEQTFYNDLIGRAYKTTGEAPPWEGLRDRAAQSVRARETVPAGHVILTCGVDCQVDRVEYQVVARAPNYRRAIVSHGVIPGHISEEKAQTALDALLKQGFKNAYGRPLQIDLLAIDGNAYTEDVWAWAKKHSSSKVIMVRGVGSEAAPLLVRVRKEVTRTGRKLPYSRRFYNFATSVLKIGLYRDLVKEDPLERGFIDLPTGLDDEYFRQMTAESRKLVKNKAGFPTYQWVKDPNQANEALDTFLQAEAAWIRIAGPTRELLDEVWARFFAERECPLPEQQLDIEDMLMPGQPEQQSALVKTSPSHASRRRRRKMRMK